MIYDHWDLDMTGNPIVINQKNKNIIFGFSKTGNIFSINLDKCEFNFKDGYSFIKVPKPDDSLKNVNYSSVQKKFFIPEPVSSIYYDLDEYLKSLDKENRDYMLHKTRHLRSNEEFIPLSLNYDVGLIGLHGGPQWPGGSFDKKNNQIIITTNHDPYVIRVYYEDQVFRIRRGINIRIKKFIDKFEFLSTYKAQELNNLQSSRIKKYVESRDYLDSYKILDSIFKSIDKLYFLGTSFTHRPGSKIYKDKCLSCHGNYRQAYAETEFTGDKFIPSLTNISLQKKFISLKNLDNFNYSHKYIENKIKISDNDLKILRKYFQNWDNFLNKLNLIHIAYKWQNILDKNLLPASKAPWGKITALDVESGKINWSIPFGNTLYNDKKIPGSINFGGLLSTMSDITFATGTTDEKVYALESSTGQELWSHKLPLSGSAPPMTFTSNKEQYILVNASGGRYYNFRKSNSEYLVAFKLTKK